MSMYCIKQIQLTYIIRKEYLVDRLIYIYIGMAPYLKQLCKINLGKFGIPFVKSAIKIIWITLIGFRTN